MQIALTLLIVALVMVGMAVGILFRRPPLKGSCGGSLGACVCSPAQRAQCSRMRPRDPEAEAAEPTRPLLNQLEETQDPQARKAPSTDDRGR